MDKTVMKDKPIVGTNENERRGRPKERPAVKALNTRVDAEVFTAFTRYCNAMGQPKTVAMQRALKQFLASQGYWDDHDPEIMQLMRTSTAFKNK